MRNNLKMGWSFFLKLSEVHDLCPFLKSLAKFIYLVYNRIGHTQKTRAVIKGCVHYIFVCLFLTLNDSPCQTRKIVFLFHFKSSFCFRENQILEF